MTFVRQANSARHHSCHVRHSGGDQSTPGQQPRAPRGLKAGSVLGLVKALESSSGPLAHRVRLPCYRGPTQRGGTLRSTPRPMAAGWEAADPGRRSPAAIARAGRLPRSGHPPSDRFARPRRLHPGPGSRTAGRDVPPSSCKGRCVALILRKRRRAPPRSIRRVVPCSVASVWVSRFRRGREVRSARPASRIPRAAFRIPRGSVL